MVSERWEFRNTESDLTRFHCTWNTLIWACDYYHKSDGKVTMVFCLWNGACKKNPQLLFNWKTKSTAVCFLWYSSYGFFWFFLLFFSSLFLVCRCVCVCLVKEGNVLFNDALNTFYLRLYGVGYMVKDHSFSERGNPLLPLHGLLFYMHHPIYRIAHTTVFVTPVVEHWLETRSS